jgi:RelE toxin of RelE / RelB toxin-antitoxin system
VAKRWNTVVETPGYLSDAHGVLDDRERADVVEMVAADPECGEVIQGTGGVRKIRVALGNRGKSAGARVIYYFLNDSYPVLLLALFTKAEKGNLSMAERNVLAMLVSQLKSELQKSKKTKGR